MLNTPAAKTKFPFGLQAIWTKKVGFDKGVAQLQKLCQEVLDKEPL